MIIIHYKSNSWEQLIYATAYSSCKCFISINWKFLYCYFRKIPTSSTVQPPTQNIKSPSIRWLSSKFPYLPYSRPWLNTFILSTANFRAHPISKLCEYEGNGIPEGKKSDCYNDVDEADFACKEKYRIMVSRSCVNRTCYDWH